MIPSNISNQVKYIIIGFVIVTISIVLYVFFISTRASIHINNYGTYINDLPSEQQNAIDTTLSNAVTFNLVQNEKMIPSTASIRGDTVSNTYSSSTNVHSGRFIVDLNNIRQSYAVSYDWSDDENNPNASGYPVVVACLSSDDSVIYKDFECKSGTAATNLPLEYELPYTDINGPFRIQYLYTDKGHVVIGIDNATPDGRKKALKWLRSKNINPADIIINYLDISQYLASFRYDTE